MKLFSSRTAMPRSHQDIIENDIQSIQNGNEVLRGLFIEKYSNYIISVASRVKGSYIEVENDEEYTTALIAFNKAIDCFNPHKGASFFTFAGLLIKRAIYDLYKKTNGICEVPFSELYGENEVASCDSHRDMDAFLVQEDHFLLKQEIAIYSMLLKEFSIDFKDLVKGSPRHKFTRQSMITLAYSLTQDSRIKEKIIRSKMLPLKEIVGAGMYSRKTLERHRRYILANFILINSELGHLKEYIKDSIKGGDVS